MEIKEGIIKDGEKVIGEAYLAYKFGYHPAVLVKIGSKRKWFEKDEKDLILQIIAYAKEIT
jgi:hypothetical protein